MNKYEILKDIIDKSHSIVVFTGAGISVPSGIPDFRSAQGLYNQKHNYRYSPEEIVSHDFFYNHTIEFYDFYKNKMLYPNAKPNAAHKYFADLEKQGKNVIVVTQNIDGLHQAAGSKHVFELHGTVHQNFCTQCGRMYDLDYVMNQTGVPHCKACNGILKPNVVLYGENLDEYCIENSIAAIMTCDTLLIIGTSLIVYPAAGFIRYFKGRNLVLINKDKTAQDDIADLVFNEDVINVINNL